MLNYSFFLFSLFIYPILKSTKANLNHAKPVFAMLDYACLISCLYLNRQKLTLRNSSAFKKALPTDQPTNQQTYISASWDHPYYVRAVQKCLFLMVLFWIV